jgi:hypothetical protein
MSAAFDRDALLDAFDRIGRAAVVAGTKLQIAVYRGSALMLASNFRFATEDARAPFDQSMVYDGIANRCHARIPDVCQPRRIRVAQYLYRRTAASTGAWPATSQGIV